MSKPQAVILASSSVYRKELLERLQIPFHCASPAIDEAPLEDESALDLVLRLAEAKARALADRYPTALIIGSDQVAVLNGEILGKPGTVENAVRQLMGFSGQEVEFLTGLCLYNAELDHAEIICEPFAVHFRELSESMVRDYIRRESPLDCAGSFKSEGLGICLFSRMQGDDPSALVGLPLIRLIHLLENQGYNLLTKD